MKRIISMICTFVLIAATCAPAYAQDISAQLPEITLKVKEALDIGDEYTDFTSSNYSGMWDLYWSRDGESVSVTCDSEGNIYNYYRYYEDYTYGGEYEPRYPIVTREELERIADEFLARVIVGENEGWILDDVDVSLRDGADARVTASGRISRYGFATDISFSITADAEDGRVYSFYRSDGYVDYLPLDGEHVNSVSADEALALLAGAQELMPVYCVVEAGRPAQLVYMPVGAASYVVRASDGELIDIQAIYSDFYESAAYASQDAGAGLGAGNDARELTEVELAGIGAYDNAMSAEELDAMLRGIPEIGLTDGYVMDDVDYYQSADGLTIMLGYARRLTEEEAAERFGGQASEGEYYDTRSVSVRAEDGSIISVYSYCPGYNSAQSALDQEGMQAVADGFIASQLAEYAENTVLGDANVNDNEYMYAATGDFTYYRTYDGYQFRDNSIYISVNSVTGVIDSLYIRWDDEQEFYNAGELFPAEAALDVYMDNLRLENMFMTLPVENEDGTEPEYMLELCWALYNESGLYAVDAHTGMAYCRDNDAGEFEYTDIGESEYAPQIAQLGQYGVGFAGGQFKPGDAFTVRDALVFIVQANNYYGDDIEALEFDELVSRAENMGAPDLSEYDAQQTLTRGEFAGILAVMSGYGSASEIAGIYDCGFADNADIDDVDYGLIAISYGLGLIDVDGEGCINAYAPLTRGEAADVMHRLLSIK